MHKLISFFLSMTLLLLMACSSYAAFPIRYTQETQDSVSTVSATPANTTHTTAQGHRGFMSRVKNAISAPFDHSRRHPHDSGWEGIVSLILGIGGIFPPFGIAAIIFGSIGMRAGKPNRSLAIAGLILGIFFLLLFAFIFFITVAFAL